MVIKIPIQVISYIKPRHTMYWGVQFKKTSGSVPPVVYFTLLNENNSRSGDLDTYPGNFKNQIYVVVYCIHTGIIKCI